MYFSLISAKGCDLLIYAFFNKEKPILSKPELNIEQALTGDKKAPAKYKYLNRMEDILNDQVECDVITRDANRIKNRRLKEILDKAEMGKLSLNMIKLQEFI